jgi:hypothetical protein
MSMKLFYTREFEGCTVGLVPSRSLSIRVAEEELCQRSAKNQGSPSSEPQCASIQSRVEFTVHRKSRMSVRNLVSRIMHEGDIAYIPTGEGFLHLAA